MLSPEAAREVLRTHTVQRGTEVGADGMERSLDGVFESPTEAGDVEEAPEPEVRPAELSEGVRVLATEGGAGEVKVEWYDARRAAAEGAWASRAEALSRLGAVVEWTTTRWR